MQTVVRVTREAATILFGTGRRFLATSASILVVLFLAVPTFRNWLISSIIAPALVIAFMVFIVVGIVRGFGRRH